MNAAPRLLLPWLLLLLPALFAAWLRYGLIEPPAAAQQCAAALAPAWCGLRQIAVRGFLSDGYGIAALAATALALSWRRPASAWLAAALGLVAVLLYCYQAGALALLIGALLLLRNRPRGAPTALPGDQHGSGQQQVQAEP